MTDALIRLNPTGLRRFYRCEYEWYAYSVLGVQALRPPPSQNRDRGKAFHALLEYAFRQYTETGEPFTFAGDVGRSVAQVVLIRLYDDESVDLGEDVSLELLDSIRHQLTAFDMDAWEVVALPDGTSLIEADLRAPHPTLPAVQLQAKVDLVLRHRTTGKVWLVDFKTSAFPIDTTKVLPWIKADDQLAIGREVLAAHGITVDFSALLHVRSCAPKPPPLVYVGTRRERTSYSAKDMSCDEPTYIATLRERGEDPSSVEALKVRDALSLQAFTRWQLDISSPATHAAVMANNTRAARRMLELVRGDAKPVRRLSMSHYRGSCHACDYGPWCTAAMDNGGTDDLTLLGSAYSARDWSPHAGYSGLTSLSNPSSDYLHWAAEHGRKLSPSEEFKP